MSAQPQPAAAPSPQIAVLAAHPVEHALAPTLRFRLQVDDSSGREVYTIALSAQVNLEPAKRPYAAEDRAALADLFGDPGRPGAATRPLVWTRADLLTPAFTGRGEFDLDLPCTYDLEVAAAKYFAALRGGEAPLAFHFSGRVLYRGEGGGLQVVLVPWTCSADFRLPVATWREMMDRHHPDGGWVRLRRDTIAALRRQATERGAPTLDAALAELLEQG